MQIIIGIGMTVLTTILSILALFLLTKMMGAKQVSQMTMFDYVIGITIGSSAAELATELEEPFRPLTALIVYALLALAISWASMKSFKARAVMQGRPLVLLEDGVIYRENLKKAKLDLTEFLTQCRIAGYFDLREIQLAVLENNGRIAFLPTSEARPATPEDLNRHPGKALPMLSVVLDGKVLRENLAVLGYDGGWLIGQLDKLGFGQVDNVFLALCDQAGTVLAYPKTREKPDQDPFQ